MRLSVAILLAEVFVVAALSCLSSTFAPRTDVIGFPIHQAFDVDSLFRIYFLQVLFFPAIVGGFYYWFRGTVTPPAPRAEPRAEAHLDRLAVGLVIALATSPWPLGGHFLPQLVFVTGAYYLAATPRLNARVLPFLPFAVYAIARESHVVVNGTNIAQPWLSILVPLALAIFLQLRPQRVALVAWPIVVYLLHARLPLSRNWVHLYHDGESLGAAALLARGWFPWRDFLFVHGLLQDPLMAMLGQRIFGDTLWGADAGVSAIYRPLFYVGGYFATWRIFGGRATYALVVTLLLPSGFRLFGEHFNLRFLLLAPIYLALFETLEKPRFAWALGALLAITVILTPEGALIAVAVLATLALYDYRRRLPAAALCAAATFGVWALYLAIHGALASYLSGYTDFGLDYRYGAGLPVQWGRGLPFSVAVCIPPLAYYAFTAHFVRAWRARDLTRTDWTLLAANLFSILYYSKFFARADEHIFAHLGLALPLLTWLAILFLERSSRGRLIGALVVLVLGVGAWGDLALDRYPERWKPVVAPPEGRFGYHHENPATDAAFTQLGKVLDDRLGMPGDPGSRLFDFTNEPALFFYLLGQLPASRYFYINMAPTAKAQRRVIAELETRRPRLVVYLSQLEYQTWDGVPGMVRHYEVSRYLLDHYHPLVSISQHLILERNDDEKPRRFDFAPVFDYEGCDWGMALHLQRAAPSAPAAEAVALPITTAREGNAYVTHLRVPRDAYRYHTLELAWSSLSPDVHLISDAAHLRAGPSAVISFRSGLSTGPTRYRVPVGSCIQWRALTDGEVLLASSRAGITRRGPFTTVTT